MNRIASFVLLLLLVSPSLAAPPTIVHWPDDVRSGFVGKIINGRYVLGPMPGSGFALSDDGVLCTFNPATSEAVLFPHLGDAASMDGAIHQKMGAPPVAVAFKRFGDRSFFVVASAADHAIAVLDAHSGAVVKTITVAVPTLNGLASPFKADAPFVYYCGIDGERGLIGRIDLRSMSDQGLVHSSDIDDLDIAASPDGNLLYVRRLHTNPSGLMVRKIVADDSGLKSVNLHNDDGNRAHPVVSPDGEFVACAAQVFAADWSSQLGVIPMNVQAVAATKPLAFGVTNEPVIAVASTNSRQLIANLGWPFNLPTPTSSPATRTSRAARSARRVTNATNITLLFDDTHQQLVALNNNLIALYSVKDLGLPSEPTMHVDINGELTAAAGQAWSATIVKHDPAVEIALGEAPTGVALKGDRLEWTPTSADIGVHRVTLSVSSGSAQVTQSITLTVKRNGITLPFVPNLLAVSPDGSRAIVVRTVGFNEDRQQRGSVSDEQLSRVALIDLQKLTIIADRTLTAPLSTASVDDHFVYAALRDSDAFVALSLTDLSDGKRIYTAGRVTQFLPVANRIYTQLAGKPTTYYTVPALAPDPVTRVPGPFDNQSTPLPTEVNGGWLIDGVIYDTKLSAAKQVVQDDTLPSIVQNRVPFIADANGDTPVGLWGVTLRYNGVRRIGGQTIFALPGGSGSPVLLHELPAVAVLTRSIQKTGNEETPDEQLTQIELFNLTIGDRLAPIVLTNEARKRDEEGPAEPHLVTGGGMLVAQTYNQLFVVPVSSIPKDNLPAPFTIAPTTGQIAIAGDQPSVISVQTTGGARPITYGLAQEMPGVQIDPDSGSVTVDPTVMKDTAGKAIADWADQRYRYDPATNTPRGAADTLAAYRSAAMFHLKSMTDYSFTGYPAALPLMVVAKDSQQQTVRTPIVLIVDVPLAAVTTPVVQAMPATQQAMPQTEVFALRRRVVELENQNRQLQAKVDALLDALSRGREPATMPTR